MRAIPDPLPRPTFSSVFWKYAYRNLDWLYSSITRMGQLGNYAPSTIMEAIKNFIVLDKMMFYITWNYQSNKVKHSE